MTTFKTDISCDQEQKKYTIFCMDWTYISSLYHSMQQLQLYVRIHRLTLRPTTFTNDKSMTILFASPTTILVIITENTHNRRRFINVDICFATNNKTVIIIVGGRRHVTAATGTPNTNWSNVINGPVRVHRLVQSCHKLLMIDRLRRLTVARHSRHYSSSLFVVKQHNAEWKAANQTRF
jgi:hypothetical protein